MHTWLHCVKATPAQVCSPRAEQKESVSHGAASPLAAGFSRAAAGALLPVQPADVLQQGAEHGTGGHAVGVVPEEGLRDCESTSCSAFSYTASQCLYCFYCSTECCMLNFKGQFSF